MSSIRHNFSIYIYYPNETDWGPRSNGIAAKSTSDVEELGLVARLPVKEAGFSGRSMHVDLDEKDPCLAHLYEEIFAKYQIRPSHWHVIPDAERQRYFGVMRNVTWTAKEVDCCEFVQLRCCNSIGDQENGNEEQWAREEYVVRLNSKQNSKVQLGLLIPFHGLAVAEPLRSELLAANLIGLDFPPVIFMGGGKVKKPLWALKSHVILPDTLNSLQNSQGLAVPPNTEWECHYDDGGRVPQTLRFKRDEVAALGPFDIAMTSARIANDRKAACRWCIVSQKFRAELKRLKIPGLSYVPVVLE
jgi:hypothetical protein